MKYAKEKFKLRGVIMVDKKKVEDLLETQIRPSLQSHGGDCELVEVTDEGVVKLVLQGACRGCPMAQMTVKQGVEATLKEALPEVKEVVAVEPGETSAQ